MGYKMAISVKRELFPLTNIGHELQNAGVECPGGGGVGGGGACVNCHSVSYWMVAGSSSVVARSRGPPPAPGKIGDKMKWIVYEMLYMCAN